MGDYFLIRGRKDAQGNITLEFVAQTFVTVSASALQSHNISNQEIRDIAECRLLDFARTAFKQEWPRRQLVDPKAEAARKALEVPNE